MKILIANDGRHAHYYQRMAWANAFRACNVEVGFWNVKDRPAFDVFDQFDPDIFMGQAYNLDDATIKCIYERPQMKVALRVGDWGDHGNLVDRQKFNILFASKKEIETLKKLKEETGQPEFVHIHYHPDAIDWTHGYFENIGIKPVSLMMCADTVEYSGAQIDPSLTCDIGFVGGYWPHKGQIIEPYLFPLLDPVGRYKVKIFGNQPWPVSQYCGVISDRHVKDVFVSATICPNLSEPHAHEFGFDINERIFKILYAGGFCISDNVEGYRLFEDGVVIADSPSDFADKIDYYLNNDDERIAIAKKGRELVTKYHTGVNRACQILGEFGYTQESNNILKTYEDFLSSNQDGK